MLQEPKFLTAEQFLLTTLVVKLAAMAALATMLARYRRFRHILIFEQRNWPDRLVFALGLAVPFTAGVAARLLLNYDAIDLTLEGALLAGLIAGPYTGAIVGLFMLMSTAILILRLLAAVPREMKAPVTLYGLAILAMGFASLAVPGPWVVLGAVAFMASDALLGIEKFMLTGDTSMRQGMRYTVWVLYYAAQLIITLGVLFAETR